MKLHYLLALAILLAITLALVTYKPEEKPAICMSQIYHPNASPGWYKNGRLDRGDNSYLIIDESELVGAEGCL